MAPILGLEPEQLRVVCPWVGGGFGPKAAVYVEYLVAAAAAQALGRPVKWTETRSEDMVSLVHGRDFVMTAKLGLKLDGTIVGLDAKVVASGGAYPAIGAILPMLTQMMSPGVYDVPKVHFDGVTAVDQHHDDGRLPRRRAPRGHAAHRAGDRRRRRRARHRPGRAPPPQLPAAGARSR